MHLHCKLLKIIILLLFFVTINQTSYSTDEEYEYFKIPEIIKIDRKKSSEICATLKEYNDFKAFAHCIIVSKDAYITWDTPSCLSLQATNSIIFEDGSLIQSKGKGGVILHPNYQGQDPTATIVFVDETKIYIDLNSQGSIAIYYNPEAIGGHHKYESSYNWNNNIKAKASKLNAFMLINTSDDLKNIRMNLSGCYALSHHLIEALPQDFSALSQFKGYFNYNGYAIGCPNPMSPRNIFEKATEPLSPRIEEFIFKELDSWGKNFFYHIAPFLEKSRKMFSAARSGNIAELVKLEIASPLEFFTLNSKGKTLLHVAARYGSESICDYVFQMEYPKDGPQLIELIDRQDFRGIKAIEITAKYFNFSLYHKLAMLYDLYKEPRPSISHLTLIIKNTLERITCKAKKFEEALKQTPALKPFWEVLEDKQLALTKEYARQQKIEKKFFASSSLHDTVKKRTKSFRKTYEKTKKPSKEPYDMGNLEGLSSFQRINLFLQISTIKLQSTEPRNKPRTLHHSFSKKSSQSLEVDQLPVQFQFGNQQYTLKNKPTSHTPGNIDCAELDDFQQQLVSLIEQIKLKKNHLISILQESRISGCPIDAKMHLKKHKYKGTKINIDAAYLNKFSILLDLEIASRLYRDQYTSIATQSPISLGISRMFFLISNKEETSSELFSTWLNFFQKDNSPEENKNETAKKEAFKRSPSLLKIKGIQGFATIGRKKTSKDRGYLHDLTAESDEIAVENDLLGCTNELYNQFVIEREKLIHTSEGWIIATQEGMRQELLKFYGIGNGKNAYSSEDEFEEINLVLGADNEKGLL